MPRLIPLGTNGFFPSHGRHTACYLFLTDLAGVAVVLDAGTGLGRLVEPAVRLRLAGVRELHVILSHYHLDHVVGLSYLGGLVELPGEAPVGSGGARDPMAGARGHWGGARDRLAVTVYAPAPPLLEAEPAVALGRLLDPPLFSLSLQGLPARVVPVRETEIGVAGLTVRLRPQRHPGGSVGIRLGDWLAYVTDTVADRETAAFARGCRLLLHEVWSAGGFAVTRPPAHSAAEEVALIAREAGVSLAPIHHPPWRSDDEVGELVRGLAAAAGVPVLRLAEGSEYALESQPDAGPPHA